MKQSTIIKILSAILAVIVLSIGFVLFTDNNISKAIFSTTTTTKPNDPPKKYDPMDFFVTDVSSYVTLGQYKNFDIEIEMLEITQEYIDEQIKNIIVSNGDFVKVESGIIEENTIFSFDFTGYLNGEAFEGGAAKDYKAYISDNVFYIVGGSTFIPGFAEGILGKSVGDEFDLDITFPEDYHSADLAGKQTVFHVKINHILEAAPFTDELAKKYSNNTYSTTQDFVDYLFKYYKEQLDGLKSNLAWKEIIENATIIEIPQQEYDYFYNYYYSNIESYASSYGMDVESFLKMGYAQYFFGYEFKSIDELKEYVKGLVKEELVIFAVMQTENITVSDEEYNTFLDELVAGTNTKKEDIIKEYGEEYIRESIQIEKVNDFVAENNNFILAGQDK